MARYRCKNCGEIFTERADSSFHTARCPKCHSAWTEYLGPDNEWCGLYNRFPKRPLHEPFWCHQGSQTQLHSSSRVLP